MSAPTSTRSILTHHAARVLGRTRAVHLLTLVHDEETGQRVMTRTDLAKWLDASDLPELAREARSRRVDRGQLLVLLVSTERGPQLRVIQADPATRARR